MSAAPSLTLYVRADCHLCGDMQRELASFQKQRDFSLNIVDIDADPYLRMRYNDRVPVLAAGEEEICHYRFNAEVLAAYFRKL